MYKYEMDPTRTVGATERTRHAGRMDGWTDGRTDRRTKWNQYIPPPPQLLCVGGIIMFEERAGIEADLVSSKSNENRKSVPNQSNKERKYFIQWDYSGFGELLGKLLQPTDVLISNMFCMLSTVEGTELQFSTSPPGAKNMLWFFHKHYNIHDTQHLMILIYKLLNKLSFYANIKCMIYGQECTWVKCSVISGKMNMYFW